MLYFYIMKKCKQCDIQKEISAFSKQTGGKFGVRGTCKECTSANCKFSNLSEEKKYRIYLANKKYQEKPSIKKKRLVAHKNWRIKNPAKASEYYHKRVSTPEGKLKQMLRVRLCNLLKSKGLRKRKTTLDCLGIDISSFKIYLEKLFTKEMNWENHGSYWHIDHIIPLDSASTLEEILDLSYYTNLQPLEKGENIRKSNKILTI